MAAALITALLSVIPWASEIAASERRPDEEANAWSNEQGSRAGSDLRPSTVGNQLEILQADSLVDRLHPDGDVIAARQGVSPVDFKVGESGRFG